MTRLNSVHSGLDQWAGRGQGGIPRYGHFWYLELDRTSFGPAVWEAPLEPYCGILLPSRDLALLPRVVKHSLAKTENSPKLFEKIGPKKEPNFN